MQNAHSETGRALQGLAHYSAAVSDAAPRYIESDVITPTRMVGVREHTTLKASFWKCEVEETVQIGDPAFVSVGMHLGGGRVWRNREPPSGAPGCVGVHPFEGARWRFEPPVAFVQMYVPFAMVADVCESLFDRELKHCELIPFTGERDERLCGSARMIQANLSSMTPTNLILDSWALILADVLVQRFSSHSQTSVRASFGKLPARGVARVVDYIEASIDRDLDLGSLANIASA